MSTRRNHMIVLATIALFALAVAAAPIRKHPQPVPGEYMVLLSPHVQGAAYDGIVKSLSETYALTILTEWREAPFGFVATNVTDADVQRLSDDPRVSLIEQNFALPPISMARPSSWNGQYLWNLDRIDKVNESFANNTYNMCPEATDVVAYVLDYGVRRDHVEFKDDWGTSRVVQSLNFTTDNGVPVDDLTDGCINDAQGNRSANPDPKGWHGTAVASVLAGRNVGASRAKIVSLRVFRCNLPTLAAHIVNAVRWIHSADDHNVGRAVANLSAGWPRGWGFGDFDNLNAAVNSLVWNRNVPFFTSAENYSADACQFAPNDLAYTNTWKGGTVFTVGGTSLGTGATTTWDYRWQEQELGTGFNAIGDGSGSNGGSCVSIYAPACAIYAASNAAPNAYTSTTSRPSGTSFASPLAAGVAARYISRYIPFYWYQVYDYLLSAAASTGTPIYNVNTVEYWICWRADTGAVRTYRTPRSQCETGFFGDIVTRDTTPFHFVSTTNSSNANILYSGGLTCP